MSTFIIALQIDIVDEGIFYDYHFWYQPLDGSWSNKHGLAPEEHLSNGIIPSSIRTSGWALSYYADFYDGPIYSYIITID